MTVVAIHPGWAQAQGKAPVRRCPLCDRRLSSCRCRYRRAGMFDGRDVAALRRVLGLSRAELAARTGVAERTVERWEVATSGAGWPSREASARLLTLLMERSDG